VTPTYMYDNDLPDLDGFGNPLAIHSDPDGYVIGSAGPDGIGQRLYDPRSGSANRNPDADQHPESWAS
jgi:hypothetical protein